MFSLEEKVGQARALVLLRREIDFSQQETAWLLNMCYRTYIARENGYVDHSTLLRLQSLISGYETILELPDDTRIEFVAGEAMMTVPCKPPFYIVPHKASNGAYIRAMVLQYTRLLLPSAYKHAWYRISHRYMK